MSAETELDEFTVPIGTGMTRVPRTDFDHATAERLLSRLDEFDAVRNRGAVEARFAWIGRP